jgi:hypothetical protein
MLTGKNVINNVEKLAEFVGLTPTFNAEVAFAPSRADPTRGS